MIVHKNKSAKKLKAKLCKVIVGRYREIEWDYSDLSRLNSIEHFDDDKGTRKHIFIHPFMDWANELDH